MQRLTVHKLGPIYCGVNTQIVAHQSIQAMARFERISGLGVNSQNRKFSTLKKKLVKLSPSVFTASSFR